MKKYQSGREIKVKKTIEGITVEGGTNHHGNGCSNKFASADFKSTSQMLHFFNLIAGENTLCDVEFDLADITCLNNATHTMYFRGGIKVAEKFIEVLKWQVAENAWMDEE